MNIKTAHTIYFLGIGGIGMSALARFFMANGKKVAGYDKTPTPLTNDLQILGAQIHFDEDVRNIPQEFLNPQDTVVIYTPAIPKSHKQLLFFNDNDFKLIKRAAVLGELTKHTFCLAVAGTHGKTTTSSILGHIMSHVNATAFLGGICENYNSNLILGEDKITVVEADEYDRSFLQLHPEIACITSMDADHLDIYQQHDALITSFNDFANQVKKQVVVAKGLPIKGATFAIDEDADYTAKNLQIVDGLYQFDIQTPSKTITNVNFQLPGKHNILNALAAAAMADIYGIDGEIIKEKLSTFKGVQRRFTYRIKTNNLVLIDDYAHHPTEIEAVQKSIFEMYPHQEVLVVFQPHLFSRTRDFLDDFAVALSKFHKVLLLDIYPARELPIEGITSKFLLDKLTNNAKKLIQKDELLQEIVKSNCNIIAMLGAGDIGEMIVEVTNNLKTIKHV